MKSFLAVTATLAAIALCAGESAAQTSMITPSSIGATSALGDGAWRICCERARRGSALFGNSQSRAVHDGKSRNDDVADLRRRRV